MDVIIKVGFIPIVCSIRVRYGRYVYLIGYIQSLAKSDSETSILGFSVSASDQQIIEFFNQYILRYLPNKH